MDDLNEKSYPLSCRIIIAHTLTNHPNYSYSKEIEVIHIPKLKSNTNKLNFVRLLNMKLKITKKFIGLPLTTSSATQQIK